MKQSIVTIGRAFSIAILIGGCTTGRGNINLDILMVDVPKDGALTEDVQEIIMPFQLEGDSAIYFPRGSFLHLGDTLSYDKPATFRDEIRKKITLNTTVYLAREDIKDHVLSLSLATFVDKVKPVSLQEIEAMSSTYDMIVIYSPEEVGNASHKRFTKLEDMRPYLIDSVVALKPNAKILCVIGWPKDIAPPPIIPTVEEPKKTAVVARVKGVTVPTKEPVKQPVTPVAKLEPKFYTLVPTMPHYPGEHDGIARHIAKNQRHPAAASGVSGTVTVSYIVDVNGRATDVRLVKGVNPYLDEEAIRVVATLSGFTPGRKDGKAVPVQLNQKVIFTN